MPKHKFREWSADGDVRKLPLTGAERNRLYRERRKAERANVTKEQTSTSASIADSIPSWNVDPDYSYNNGSMDVITSDASCVSSTDTNSKDEYMDINITSDDQNAGLKSNEHIAEFSDA